MKKSVSLTCGHESFASLWLTSSNIGFHPKENLLLWERKRVEANTSEKETLNSR